MIAPGLNDFYNVHDAEPNADGLIEAVLIPLRDLVLFPNMVSPLFVGRERSLAAISAAHDREETAIGVAQLNIDVTDPMPDDLNVFGTEMALGRPMRMMDGTVSVLAQGLSLIHISEPTRPY